MPWIRSACIRVAGDRLIVTTREPVNHPIAMLGIQLGCDSPLRRDYPVLLQPLVGPAPQCRRLKSRQSPRQGPRRGFLPSGVPTAAGAYSRRLA